MIDILKAFYVFAIGPASAPFSMCASVAGPKAYPW